MQIIWDEEAAGKLRERHVVLELETFNIEGTDRTVYCVVPVEKIGLKIASVDGIVALHAEFVEAYKNKNYTRCQELSTLLMGSFEGELDTYYEEIISRILALEQSSNTR